MSNIFGVMTETSSENKNSNDYDEIVNLVGACGDNAAIPGELVVEILSRLPVESLIRFKSVCKPWKLLINSPIFIDIHLRMEKPEIHHCYKRGTRIGEEDDFLPIETSYIVGVCNGIVCYGTTRYQCQKNLLLCNPSTGEFSWLPDECNGDFYGFYYNSQTQKYHIISFSYQRDNRSLVVVKNLTLGKTFFRDVKDVIVPGHIRRDTAPITSGTSLFWSGEDDDENKIVIWYDVIEERFSSMNVPSSSFSSYNKLFKGLEDSVIMLSYLMLEPTFFDIWMLIDDASKGKRWMKYRKVGPFEPGVTMKPVDVCWSGKRILCFKYNDKELFYYNLETNQVEDYEAIFPPISNFVNYVESLVPINSLVPCIHTKWYL